MANDISGYLAQILSAVKGEDVRGAIHDAIKACYTDGTWNASGNTVDELARERINALMSNATGAATETLLFPRNMDQVHVSDDNGGNMVYCEGMSIDLNETILPDNDGDPAKFDLIRVYFQVVRNPLANPPYYSTPQVFEFTPSDFANTTCSINGYNFGSSNNHLRLRRFDIARDTQNYPSDPKKYIVKSCAVWKWDGGASDAAQAYSIDGPEITAEDPYPAGAIVKIVGVRYVDVNAAVQSAVEQTGGGGLTSELKAALDALAQNVMYVNGNGSTYYNNLHNALYSSGGGGSDDPTPDPTVTVTSITAVYSQPGTVYDTDTLNSLKSNLVVTANYSDETSGTVTGYTLSGNLTAGTSTITVTYSGKTTTFTVNVTAAQVDYIEGEGWTSGSPYTGLSLVENSYFTPSSNKIASYTNWSRTKYIDCDGASSISFPKLANNNANYCFFFANAAEDSATNAPLERFSLTSAQTKAVPSGAKYFMICGTSTDMATFIVNDITPTV